MYFFFLCVCLIEMDVCYKETILETVHFNFVIFFYSYCIIFSTSLMLLKVSCISELF